MRVLVLFAHPVETSFVAALHRTAIETLRRGGHAVDDCDLYAEGFDPVLSRQERALYHDTTRNQAGVASHVARLKAAEALVLVYPVWNFGFPAILKGYLDRVWIPGVSFNLDAGGGLTLTLGHVRKVAAVCTYGGSRWRAMLAGDPPRRMIKRVIRPQIALRGSCDYVAHYDMNHTTAARRSAFLAEVEATFARW